MNKINIGIVGYGNLGKGVEKSIALNQDLCLKAIFTRREPDRNHPLQVHISNIEAYKGKIDVMILCGGSATDLPEQCPVIAKDFNTIDSFDTHAKIPEYFAKIDEISKKAGTLSLISTGWDPGLFSMNRLLGEAILPNGQDYTFWGEGVSQGHSDAIRRIKGVKLAVQYTVPVESALEKVRAGENPSLSTREKHTRLCFVVAETDSDLKQIEEQILTMPNYFKDYDTTVNFIDEKEFYEKHTGMPHGGFVIRTGETSQGVKQKIEFQLKLESNPEFTSAVLAAYARAVHRLASEGQIGCRSVFDIPLAYISPKSREQLLSELL